jgi:DNA modification methylase
MSAITIHGDCRDVLPLIASESVDGVITDPPYGIAYTPRRASGKPDHPWYSMKGDRDFDPNFHAAWLKETYRVLRPSSHLYVFCADYHLGTLRDLVKAAGFRLKRTLVWEKNCWTLGDCKGDWGHQTEFIVFAHKGRRELARPRQGNVLHFPRVPSKRLRHPTEKPVELLRLLVKKSVPEGGLVLDPFAGSGSTGEAAAVEGRRAVLIEADSQYSDVIVARSGCVLAAGDLKEE